MKRTALSLLIILVPLYASADFLDDAPPVRKSPDIKVESNESFPSSETRGARDKTPSTEAEKTTKKKSTEQADKKSLGKKTEEPITDKKLPVHFTGEGLSGSREKGFAEIHKNVVVTQGDLRLASEKAEVYYDEITNDIVKIIVKGNVKMLRNSKEAGETVRANSDRAEFDAQAQKVLLQGNAELFRGQDVMRGQSISYDLKTGWIDASKVKGVVKP
jgi:lipopolysaccharide transport protein LptA